MTQGRQALRDWLQRAHRNQKTFARELGVSEVMVSYLVTGERKPSIDVAARIETLTGIPMRAWATQVNNVRQVNIRSESVDGNTESRQ